jgi:hypothetical protein
MEDLNPTNPELEAAAVTMNHSREMQSETYEQIGEARVTLPVDESEEQSLPEDTEDTNL